MQTPRRTFLKAATGTIGAVGLAPWVLDVEATQSAAVEIAKDDIADAALSIAKSLGATYADIRVNRYRSESIVTREQQVQNVARTQSAGFGVRVLVKGTWGFAASPLLTAEEARRVTQAAIEIARANARYQRKPVTLVSAPKAVTTWKSAFQKDPFEASLDDKIQFLLKLNAAAMRTKGVTFVNSSMRWFSEQKFLATSDGSRIEQYLIRGYPNFRVTAVDGETGDFQSRDSLAAPQAKGYEYLDDYPWLTEAQQAGEEAVMKLKAKPVDPGTYDLVLHPSHLWLTVHESVGHSTELDRALGWEANYAGTSFLTPDKLGKLRFASKIVNFVADRTQPSGLATVGYDDEGVAAQRWYLVKDGVFVDWQTTRDLAPLIGRRLTDASMPIRGTAYLSRGCRMYRSNRPPRMSRSMISPPASTTAS
jgi:TldD protein